jgi:hypothetical protein
MINAHEPFDFHEAELDEQLEQLEYQAPLPGNRPDAHAYASLKALYAPVREGEEQVLARVHQRLLLRGNTYEAQRYERSSWAEHSLEQPTAPLQLPFQSKRQTPPWLRTLVAVLVVGLLLGGFLEVMHVHSLGTQPLSPTPMPQKLLPWHMVATPNLPSPSSLSAITTLSANDAWVVGTVAQPAGVDHPLILHWDGHTWVNIQDADSNTVGELSSLSATGPDDIWAVGSANQHNKTLIEHWNGQAWQVIASPMPGKGSASFSSVVALARNDAWAVGEYEDGSTNHPMQALIEHWNGSHWVVVPAASADFTQRFTSIAALSASDIWAVGNFSPKNSEATYALIEHWNGKIWQVVSSPDPIKPANQIHVSILYAISASSPTDIWAVGGTTTDDGNPPKTLVEHWNGQRWAILNSPNPFPPTINQSLLGVIALAPDNVWASCVAERLLLHWNGQTWQTVALASQNTIAKGFAPNPSTPGSLWLAGYNESPPSPSALIETNSP